MDHVTWAWPMTRGRSFWRICWDGVRNRPVGLAEESGEVLEGEEEEREEVGRGGRWVEGEEEEEEAEEEANK